MDTDPNDRLAALESRVAALETVAQTATPPSGPALPNMRQLEDLRHREGPAYTRGDHRGVVTFAGWVASADGDLLWTREHGLPHILDLDDVSLARALAALGHPARLGLVRALLDGERSSQELQAVIGAASAGQLYHHLKDLLSAGMIDQAGRNRYRIHASRVIPLLVILAAAGDVASVVEPEPTTTITSKETQK